MKRNTYIIAILSVLVVILGFKIISSENINRDIQRLNDQTFKHQLGMLIGSFSVEVNEYTYRGMIASVYSLASMSTLTSYEDINDDLDVSLHNLYISLREERSKALVLSRIDELRDLFYIMQQDPSNQKATDKLIEITNETFFENPIE
ncbi:hypothetical protein [Paenibacillus daejeonensis]|uniref:hypothetical protein n=1 Tax=Paenibacillus daejeonensis TaxID=135193 RepID=UPI000374403E|nr:hypothetical protein [Paenibacillus daejeonensis]